MTKFGKFLEKNIKQFTGEALESVLKDCEYDVNSDDIEAAWFSNSGWGISDFQHCIRGQVALTANQIDKIPIINVENACAGASTAFHGAWTAIKAGLYDCTLAIGVEKGYNEDREKMMEAFIAATDVERTTKLIEQLKKMARKRKEREAKRKGTEVKKKRSHSAFMDLYAAAARFHMKKYGTTQRQLAVVAAKNHNNSTLNPLAQYTFPLTVEQALEDYEVAYPLTRSMCAPVGDGAAAAIICSENWLKVHSELKDRAILIRASILRSGSWTSDDIAKRASRAAYEMAGLSPKDIHVAEVHDATAFGEIHQIEQMGFCPIGEGGSFTESGATALDGKIPVNPSGGLLSRGHPIGASGLAQIYELITQLRGEAGERQVNKARIALAENGGGNIGVGEAAMCVHIFEKL